MRSRAIYGCAGPVLSAAEQGFFREVRPWGFILFGRNIENPRQVRALVEALRESVEDGAVPILIDQEGGRVARLKPPYWTERPAAAIRARGTGHSGAPFPGAGAGKACAPQRAGCGSGRLCASDRGL